MKLKELLGMRRDKSSMCDLSIHDPDFNEGKGKRFFNAFDRACKRGDFQ